MKHILLIGFAAVALVLAAVMLGSDSPLRLAENTPAAAEGSIHRYGDSDQSCQEWTDGCRTCTRAEIGALVCSNLPIACQPAAITCARRAEAAKPEPPKPN